MKMQLDTAVGYSGEIRLMVYDKGRLDGPPVIDSGWQKNLINNSGMNVLSSATSVDQYFNLLRYYGHIFTGTDDVREDSGTITGEQSGTTVTASAAFFTSATPAIAVDDLIVWDDGTVARITAVTDDTHVEVADDKAVAAAEFTVYRASKNTLSGHLMESHANGGFGAEETQTVVEDVAAKTVTLESVRVRAFDVVGDHTITGFGFNGSVNGSSGANLHILEMFRDLAGVKTTYSITDGQTVKLIHKMKGVITNWGAVSKSFDMVGLAANTSAASDTVTGNLTYFYGGGLPTSAVLAGALALAVSNSYNGNRQIINATPDDDKNTAIANADTLAVSGSYETVVPAYSNNAFERISTLKFKASGFNDNPFYGLFFAGKTSTYGNRDYGYKIIFDTAIPQKTNTLEYTFDVRRRATWIF